MLVDSHSHFDAPELDADRASVLARARAAGVTRQVVPAVTAASWPKLRDVCAQDVGLFAAYGLHPMYLSEHRPAHLDDLRTRPQDFDPDTRERFMAGALLPGAWYVKAQRFRRRYRANVLKVFEEADIVLAPATPCTAPKLGQVMMKLDGIDLPVRANLGLFTQPISFIGLPVVVAPLQRPGGLPIGMMFTGQFGDEAAGEAGCAIDDDVEFAGCRHVLPLFVLSVSKL